DLAPRQRTHQDQTRNLLYKEGLGLAQHSNKVSAARHLFLYVIFHYTRI
ncbi:MAG: hypothetical protein ACI9T7_003724, partial [Oleiphilaceae bacterium]